MGAGQATKCSWPCLALWPSPCKKLSVHLGCLQWAPQDRGGCHLTGLALQPIKIMHFGMYSSDVQKAKISTVRQRGASALAGRAALVAAGLQLQPLSAVNIQSLQPSQTRLHADCH